MISSRGSNEFELLSEYSSILLNRVSHQQNSNDEIGLNLMFNIYTQKYTNFTHVIFLSLFLVKLINVIQNRIDFLQFLAWVLPLVIFYYFLNKLIVRTYQWFCFFLMI